MLTQKAVDLLRIIVEMHLWAEKHLTITPETKAIIEEVKNDKEGFIKKQSQRLAKEFNQLADSYTT